MKDPEILNIVKFGDPILRAKSKSLAATQVASSKIKHLVRNIQHTNSTKKYGVGIAAPQVGESIALALIDIKPSKTRPRAPTVKMVIINPSYKGIGQRRAKWEGCLSSGTGKNTLFAKVPRYSKIDATWIDETANLHNEELTGIVAHVFQHETDHLDGILFVDKVRDTSTYMLASEYKKRIVKIGGEYGKKSKR